VPAEVTPLLRPPEHAPDHRSNGRVPRPAQDYEATDLGNARRLVAEHGQDIHFVPEWGKWVTWTGTYWAVDV
jgi:putative DNA primase/helicase